MSNSKIKVTSCSLQTVGQLDNHEILPTSDVNKGKSRHL